MSEISDWLRACATNEPHPSYAEKLWQSADLIAQQAAKIAELERRIADGESDENKGLWRFWNDKARELAEKLTVMTASRDGYAKQDAARLQIARNEVIEEIAVWIEPQRVVIPAHGWEFAAAIRSLKEAGRSSLADEGKP